MNKEQVLKTLSKIGTGIIEVEYIGKDLVNNLLNNLTNNETNNN